MRKEGTQGGKMFANIKTIFKNENDLKGRPYFIVADKHYSTLSGLITNIYTETREIIPTKGDNAGKKVKVYNLLINIRDTEGDIQIQLPLYSGLARTAMNFLAGPDELNEVFFSVYYNKNGFKSISIKNADKKDAFITPKYQRQEELALLEDKFDKGETNKDYDKLSLKYVDELIPVILKKIGFEENNNTGSTEDRDIDEIVSEAVESEQSKESNGTADKLKEKAKAQDDDDLPF